jgi:hypothetical protein
MALYGAIVSAPLGHVLISLLQKVFQGRKSLKAKIMQILVSNLIVSRPATAVCGVLADQADRPYSEQRLPGVHGAHCGCAHPAPGQRDCPRWFLASDEGQLDRVPDLAGLCSAVPPREHVGALLQHHRLRHRHLYQRTHKEEEACSPEAETLRRWRQRHWPRR